jgi:large subunit ribosomal protein L4
MVRQALRAALSDRAMEGRVCLVDRWSFEVPKTKDAVASLAALGVEGNVLVVIGGNDVVAERSFSNLAYVNIVEAGQLTAYDVVVSDWVVFTDETMPGEVSDAPEGSVVANSSRPLAGELAETAEAGGPQGDETAEAPATDEPEGDEAGVEDAAGTDDEEEDK